MKALKILVAVGVVGFAVYYYFANIAFYHPLAGTWKSDRDKSIKAFYKVGVTADQEAELNRILGDMEMTFRKHDILTVFQGDTKLDKYTILAEKNGCYTIEVLGEQDDVCIVDGNLHVTTTFKGAQEVFVRQ